MNWLGMSSSSHSISLSVALTNDADGKNCGKSLLGNGFSGIGIVGMAVTADSIISIGSTLL